MKKFELVATTFQGLEEVLAAEIKEIGGTEISIARRAVSFQGDKALMYRANISLRTAIRILKPISTFKVRHEDGLYKKIQAINWSKYMSVNQTLAIDAVVASDYFNHSQYVALKTKDAIVDQFREQMFKRPNVNRSMPDLKINVLLIGDRCTVSLDSSGDSLHKRGYRKEGYLAPINEGLAAGLLLVTGWKGEKPLMDPMCGSGTFLIEAAMIATNTPPQLNRTYFSCKRWLNFDEELWDTAMEEAKSKMCAPKSPILGFDKAFQAVRIAERNAETAQMSEYITFTRKPFQKNVPFHKEGIIVSNPPYGERIETSGDIVEFYQMIGDQFKQQYKGYEAWVISSNLPALKLLGLRANKKVVIFNGALECQFRKYELY